MNILIIKTGALGDVARCSFVAQALKEKYKSKKPKVYWLTDKKAIPFFINNVYTDKLFSLENRSNLAKIKFDLIINLEEGIEDCKFAQSLNPKKIIGFICRNNDVLPTSSTREWYDMSVLGKKPQNDILKKKNKKTHRQIISEIIGIKEYKKYEPFFRLTNKQRDLAQDFLRRHKLSRTDIIVGINTGSADRWPKQLSIKKTAKLIDLLYKKFNAKILLFGGPNETERNREIHKLTKSPLIDTGCGNNLFEFPSLISVCNLFITADTLGLHIALALKRKTICLIGPTSPSEIDTYKIGEKVIAKSKCICCYDSNCKSMEKIDLNDVLKKVDKLISQNVTLLITAFKEPNIRKTLEAALNQKTNYDYDIILSAPDEETLDVGMSYAKKHKNLKVMKDPGKGKSFALNNAFKDINTDILILTDGDVYISDNSINDISNLFLNPEIGAVTGKPVPIETKNNKYGFWAHFLFNAAHRIRAEANKTNSFIECSGYLFAFRKDKIKKIPLDVAEDTIIPYILWQKGYKIAYAPNAKVYVKNSDNWNDWITQKTRTHKSHGKLSNYVDTKTTKRVKSFKTEIKGIRWLIGLPSTPKEFWWVIQLIFARLYTWWRYFKDTKLLKNEYQDAWERIESTK